MTALEIIFCNLGVTVGTIDPPDSFAWSVFLRIDIRMALDTRDVFVCRILDVIFVDSKRNLLAFYGFKNIGFFMAR